MSKIGMLYSMFQRREVKMDLQQGNTSPIDMKQLLFNNLQFLGLDAPAMEASNHIPFNK